ncbi:WecB/TagA/CpsF family glycosyltransferase [Jatrophihabitans endophyticus]|uniref:WecB/TagA/CpsF family glycosyltransferase n=1 Tax=Jatrophihabitans endophyticus TaxID=1206085 RepID=UPI00190EB795|nr:WecB/TagA/CpsF family glycosyltransferase [Jatrophihabitans endophyticus]
MEVTAASMSSATEQIFAWVDAGRRAYVCVSDTNGLVNAAADPELLSVYNGSGMTLPDGMPLVWAGKRAGFSDMTRVCGPDLLPETLRQAVDRGHDSFFYGGAPGVAEEMVQRLRADIPGLRVAGTASPPYRPMTPDEVAADIAAINESGAALVWVGLGAPKQEKWMADHIHLFDRAVVIGVGAAFDMHAGRVRRAPLWAQRHGVEWLFRLAQEPRRLWRRYARAVPTFVWGALRQRPRAVASRP